MTRKTPVATRKPAAVPAGYAGIHGGIVELLDAARQAAARSVNALMTASYWEIGRRIVEAEQKGRRRAGYGEQLMARLSADLTARFGRGFSPDNLENMRRFFAAYPLEAISETLSRKSGDGLPIKNSETVSRKFDLSELAQVFTLPWSAYVRLLSVKDDYARQFYEAEALRGGWSVRQLDRQIGSQFYERTALSKDKAAMLVKGSVAKPEDAVTPNDAIKDPYVLEFLDLKDEYSESDLEAALIQRLEDFLLELGEGFTFVGRQRRRRAGKVLNVNPDYLVEVKKEGKGYVLNIPENASEDNFSIPSSSLEPIEIIDGQHRLFATDELGMFGLDDEYEVPVVIFDGLTESWQAYLFWVINVEPKKINPSLAYDLYPELRSQSWLESGETIKVYQEHRAQELTEVLWRHTLSPWKDRIELHGNRVEGHVSNAAFIRSLMISFVRRWGNENRIGGLFGSIDREGRERVLPWKRSQQAAFIIACWQHVHNAVKNSKAEWVRGAAADFTSRSIADQRKTNIHDLHPAFAGNTTLLATDQGVRSVFVVLNAICQVLYSELDLEAWDSQRVSDSPEDEDVSDALEEFSEMRAANDFLSSAAKALIDGVDWRTSSSNSLSQDERQQQAAFRGSTGYSLLQSKCLECLQKSTNKQVSEAAKIAAGLLGR